MLTCVEYLRLDVLKKYWVKKLLIFADGSWNLLLKEPNIFINCPTTHFDIGWHFILNRICRKNSTSEYRGIHLGLYQLAGEFQNIWKDSNFYKTLLLISISENKQSLRQTASLLLHIFCDCSSRHHDVNKAALS